MNEHILEHIKNTIEGAEPYPGYPTSRLTLDVNELDGMTDIEIPEGPWEINNNNLPSPEVTAKFAAAGYAIDSKGRPLHPGFREMVTDPNVGVVTGRGRYWEWGPNYTADPIVITRTAYPRILLIKRGDTGAWALPGGFVDPQDTDASMAALRELKEEATLTGVSDPQEVYVGVVGDKRTTAHAWAETSAYLMQLDRQVPVFGQDDAKDARWFRLDQLKQRLFGSHEFLINQALPFAEFEQKKSIIEILGQPKDMLDIEVINAGHMAYDHLFVRSGESDLFVKQHIAERFSDPFREAHSRAYLEKEFNLYEYVAQRGFSYIPDRVDLIDDSMLAMDALKEEDGWLWRAPRNEQFDTYVQNVLAAIEQLELVPVDTDSTYHEVINPTYETFWEEGWSDISEEKIEAIKAKIIQLSEKWSEDQKESALSLIISLSALRERAKTIDRNVPLFMAHNDVRQSNIAWHPREGARFVDWSWGDPAPHNADSTMFIVDLAKSGHDISKYKDRINSDQLVVLIGFWLAHSLWETRDGSSTVREHQVASAVAAHNILTSLQ